MYEMRPGLQERKPFPCSLPLFMCAGKSRYYPTTYEQKPEVKRQRNIIDFHNIARDLERKVNGSSEDTDIPRKRKQEGSLSPRSKKTVLLEKTNITNHSNTANINKDCPPFQDLSELDKLSTNESKIRKSSAFAEIQKAPEQSSRDVIASDVGLQSDCSAFSFVVPKSALGTEERVLWTQQTHHTEVQNSSSPDSDNISDSFKSKPSLGYRNVLASHLFHADLPSAHAGGVMSAPLATGGSFYYAPDWTRSIGGQMQSTSSLTRLPPTFTPLGVSVQNWCAKCNLSFRMTSDLVFHMRSHHKKEFAVEAQVRRRREKLTCPICHEYFRERHHLSRHMTSHN